MIIGGYTVATVLSIRCRVRSVYEKAERIYYVKIEQFGGYL